MRSVCIALLVLGLAASTATAQMTQWPTMTGMGSYTNPVSSTSTGIPSVSTRSTLPPAMSMVQGPPDQSSAGAYGPAGMSSDYAAQASYNANCEVARTLQGAYISSVFDVTGATVLSAASTISQGVNAFQGLLAIGQVAAGNQPYTTLQPIAPYPVMAAQMMGAPTTLTMSQDPIRRGFTNSYNDGVTRMQTNGWRATGFISTPTSYSSTSWTHSTTRYTSSGGMYQTMGGVPTYGTHRW